MIQPSSDADHPPAPTTSYPLYKPMVMACYMTSSEVILMPYLIYHAISLRFYHTCSSSALMHVTNKEILLQPQGRIKRHKKAGLKMHPQRMILLTQLQKLNRK